MAHYAAYSTMLGLSVWKKTKHHVIGDLTGSRRAGAAISNWKLNE
jgi:hypothetical protein